MELLWIILVLLGILAGYNLFIFLLEKKVSILEKRIKSKFIARTNLVPSIFEISKSHISKHEEIFKEILRLRKVEFNESENTQEIAEMIETEGLIHHELNFIFRVCNTQAKLVREGKFIYLREVIVQISMDLGKDIELYRLITRKYNSLLHLNKWFIIGLFTPMRLKIEI